MQLLVLLGLAALWIAVLLPDFVRRRSTRRPSDTITSFKRHLSVLERQHARTSGARYPMGSNVVPLGDRMRPQPLSAPVRPLVAPAGSNRQMQSPQMARPQGAPRPSQERRSSVQQRRQDVIVALLAGSLLSFLATLTFSGAFLYLHVAIDVVLVMYVLAVLVVTRRSAGRSEVRYLHTARQATPNMAMVRSQPAKRSMAR